MDLVVAAMEMKFAEGGAELPPGEFRGYASVFGCVDSHGDVVAPGAFRDTLAMRAAAGRRHVPMHVMHRVLGGDGLPIGVWKSVAEDDKGLRVHGKISGMDTDPGKLHAARLRDGAYGGLSIGFNTIEAINGKGTGEPKRLVTKVELHEISLVTDPSNARAIVDEFKARHPGPDDLRAVTNHGKAVQAVAAAMALHGACMSGNDSPDAGERQRFLGHLQDAHEALTGRRMPDGMKAARSVADFIELFAAMGVPPDRAGTLGAAAYASATDRSEEIRAVCRTFGLSGFKLPFG